MRVNWPRPRCGGQLASVPEAVQPKAGAGQLVESERLTVRIHYTESTSQKPSCQVYSPPGPLCKFLEVN
jgi:hypothetical protein